MFIIISGSPADGFTYYGPFESPEEGIEWAGNAFAVSDQTWWLVTLETPSKVH